MKLEKNKIPYGFITLCLMWLVLMVLVIPLDYDWTLSLREHRIKFLDQFMGQTLFEGEPVGGGDPVIFFILLTAAAYYFAWKFGPASRFYAWRPHLGFILTSALTCSVILVHSLKWGMGRARPALVLKDRFPFTDWFVFGPHFITEGAYRGSFPSGHTAQVFVLVSFAYVMAAAVSQPRFVRLAGWLWGGFSLGYVALMGVSRCMSSSHWLSDVLGAAGLSWILMHAVYFWLLKIPKQTASYHFHGEYPESPLAWELRLCVYLLGMALGGVGLVLGVRAFMLDAHWALYLLIPAGIVMGGIFYQWFRRLYFKVMEGFS